MATNVEGLEDSRHIFTVAARSLKDCVDLLQTLKAAIASEKEEEEKERHRQNAKDEQTVDGSNSHAHPNGSLQPPLQQPLSNGHTNDHRIMDIDQHQNHTTPAHPMCDINHSSRSTPQNQVQEKDVEDPSDLRSGSDMASPLPSSQATHATQTSTDTAAALMHPHAMRSCKRSEMYTKPSVSACQGTIGKHVRHLHDHYRLLLSTFPPRKVPMENDIDYAIKELEHLQFMLEQTRDRNMNTNSTESLPMPSDLLQPVTLQATIDPSHPPVSFQTTFGRELWFCSLHAVHHFAMIKVICGEFGMPLTEGFGLAPSTVKSRQGNQ
ncbi:hypothetical protein BGX34_005818 [Mortierella sp. NVP85]|nr:hypothetical protein BGX34_005818 [Mortierella sp. NVP85]